MESLHPFKSYQLIDACYLHLVYSNIEVLIIVEFY